MERRLEKAEPIFLPSLRADHDRLLVRVKHFLRPQKILPCVFPSTHLSPQRISRLHGVTTCFLQHLIFKLNIDRFPIDFGYLPVKNFNVP